MNRSPKKVKSPGGGPGARPRLRAGPLILIGAGVLILISVLIFQLSSLPTTTAPQTTSAFEIPFPNVVRISVNDAKTALDNQSALFVDVRDAGTYGSSHIKGAVNIPLDELDSRLSELPKDRWIITYCT
jgi:hypothetical protein